MGTWIDVDMTDVEAAQESRAQLEAEMAMDLEDPRVQRAYGLPPMDPEGPEDLNTPEWALDLPF